MTPSEVTRIKELISKAESESLKSQGALDTIKAKWKELYGTDDIEVIKSKKEEMLSQLEKLETRRNVVYDSIVNAHDWEKLSSCL